jgi:hypothetical protein
VNMDTAKFKVSWYPNNINTYLENGA